jgi:hypothetical protein
MVNALLAIIDLFEAEGRRLRRGVLRVQIGIILLCVTATLFLGGAGLLVWALLQALSTQMSPPLASLLSGFTALGGGGCILWLALRIVR